MYCGADRGPKPTYGELSLAKRAYPYVRVADDSDGANFPETDFLRVWTFQSATGAVLVTVIEIDFTG